MRGYAHHLRAFERFLARVGVVSLDELSPVSLSSFVADSGRRIGGCGMQSRCSVLRSFLRYLYREEITPHPMT